MAEPHSLNVGDLVTHPQWPEGTTRRVKGLGPLPRISRKNGRAKIVDSTIERVIVLDEPVADGIDYATAHWMEAGLEKVEGAPSDAGAKS